MQAGLSKARDNAALLQAAEERLGKLLAELYAAMPSLAACGFKSSFEKRPPALMRHSMSQTAQGARGQDAASSAIAAVAPAMGVDMEAASSSPSAQQMWFCFTHVLASTPMVYAW